MNLSYLQQYVSYNLHTIVRRYSLDYQIQEYSCGRIDFNDNLSKSLEHRMFTLEADKMFPKIILLNDNIIYAVIKSPENIFLVGPVRFNGTVVFSYTLKTEDFSDSFLQDIPVVSYDSFLADLLLLYNLFTDTPITKQELLTYNYPVQKNNTLIQKNFCDLIFSNQESNRSHNPYDQELREQNSIREGDVEQLKKSWEEDYTGMVGILAKDKLRHNKNLGIVLVTLACRSAMAGGLLPEIAYSLSDVYINQIEESFDVEHVVYIGREAELQYTEMIRDLKDQKKRNAVQDISHPKVEKCKDYIFTHLHGKILLSDIAEELKVNQSYLSELFKKVEGISITEFILQEKLKLVKNLLIYSPYSFSEIAAYLGFSSQSHLGELFKKDTGMTLRQYRTKLGVKEFIRNDKN